MPNRFAKAANAWQTPGLVGKWSANQFQLQLLSDCTVFKFGNFPESITPDELDEAFGVLEDGPANSEVDGGEILQGNVYDLTELDKVDKGMAPSGFQDDIQQLGTGSGAGTQSIDALLASRGVSDI